MTVTKDKYVTIEYRFTSPEGELLGSSDYSGPYTFRQGSGDVVPGLDARIEGRTIGEQLTFTIPPEEAYGPRDETKIKRLAKRHLQLECEPEVGMRFNINDTLMVVSAVRDDEVELDANHPLAGMALHFDVSIRDVSDEAPAHEHECSCGGSCGCGSDAAEAHAHEHHHHHHEHNHECSCGGTCGCGGH